MIEQFHRPATLREALALKRRLRTRAAWLAGGTHVNSSDNDESPEQVIHLADLGLDRIEVKAGRLRIGACVTLQGLIEDRRVPVALKAAAAQVVTRNIRNAATLGGHVAARLPLSDVVPMLVALDAAVVVSGAGAAKTVSVADYVVRPVPGLITRIELRAPAAGRVTACRNLRESANARSVVSVAVSANVKRGVVSGAIIALSGIGRCVTRIASAERALEGKVLPSADVLQALVSVGVRPIPSPTGSVALRKYAAGSLVALCLHEAVAAKGGRP
jgi:putative selenate reductase FAD-binding subunit